MDERQKKKENEYQEQEKTGEIWKGDDAATTSSDVEREYEKGKTPRVDSDLEGDEKIIVNPPDGGGKILKDAVGARGHNPGHGRDEK